MGYFNNINEAFGKVVNNSLILEDTYKNSIGRTYVKIRCTLCNKERYVEWAHFNYGNYKKCGCTNPKENLKVGDIYGTDTIVSITRKSDKPAFTVRCNICGTERTIERYKFYTNRYNKCKCARNKVDYSKRYKDLIGKEDDRLNFKILALTKCDQHIGLEVQCTKCNRHRIIRADAYLRGDDRYIEKCLCDEKSQPFNKYHGDELRNILREKYGNLIGTRSGFLECIDISSGDGGTTVLCKCHCGCNKEVEVSMSNFKLKRVMSCGENSTSFGEKVIEHYLQNNKIEYRKEYTYDDLKSPRGYKLRYDFALNINGEIVLIEFDGTQHKEDKGHFTGSIYSDFEYRKLCDELKDNYAKALNIKLFRIDYTNSEEKIIRELDNIIDMLCSNKAI